MRPSPIESSVNSDRQLRIALLALILATVVTHLAVSIYYVTGPMSPFPALTLHSSGDAFLSAFPGWNNREEFDDAAYNRAAVEILHTGIPRDHTGALFLYAPVYAYFVAGCYWIGGFRILAIAVPQAILSALACGILATATYRVSGQFRILPALIAGFLFVINARVAMYVGYVSPTILLIFFFSIAIFAASRPASAASLSVLVASLILAAWTQAGFFFTAVLVALWLIVRFLRTRLTSQIVAAGAIFLLAGSKGFLPMLFHQSSQGSVNETGKAILWEANNPYYERMGLFSLWERRPGNPWTHWEMSPAEHEKHDAYLERTNHKTIPAAVLWIRENPGHYVKLMFVRFWTTLGPFTGMMSPRNRLISLAIWTVTFPVGAYGWWVCRRAPITGFAAAVALSIMISSTLVVVEWYLRYRIPLELLMTMFAGIGYGSLIGRVMPFGSAKDNADEKLVQG